jgi:hypothetical protein
MFGVGIAGLFSPAGFPGALDDGAQAEPRATNPRLSMPRRSTSRRDTKALRRVNSVTEYLHTIGGGFAARLRVDA